MFTSKSNGFVIFYHSLTFKFHVKNKNLLKYFIFIDFFLNNKNLFLFLKIFETFELWIQRLRFESNLEVKNKQSSYKNHIKFNNISGGFMMEGEWSSKRFRYVLSFDLKDIFGEAHFNKALKWNLRTCFWRTEPN